MIRDGRQRGWRTCVVREADELLDAHDGGCGNIWDLRGEDAPVYSVGKSL